MAFVQLIALTIASQLLQGLAVYAKAAGAAATTAPEKSKYSVWGQVATNLGKLTSVGITAAGTELTQAAVTTTLVTSNEKAVAAAATALPPIT